MLRIGAGSSGAMTVPGIPRFGFSGSRSQVIGKAFSQPWPEPWLRVSTDQQRSARLFVDGYPAGAMLVQHIGAPAFDIGPHQIAADPEEKRHRGMVFQDDGFSGGQFLPAADDIDIVLRRLQHLVEGGAAVSGPIVAAAGAE